MKKQLTNAVYGALDYASYPLIMLAVAPLVLRRLGAGEYGLWMIATSIVSAGGIIASGFGDAGIQRIAALRAKGQKQAIEGTIRSMLSVSLSLGGLLAAATWIAAPAAAAHITHTGSASLRECIVCIRIASVLILLRALETIAVVTQRAFEEYRRTVQVSVAVRLLTLLFAASAPFLSIGMEGIMLATAFCLAGGVIVQFHLMQSLVGKIELWPLIAREEGGTLLQSGVFVWLQATSSVVFRQLDRILLGISLGAAAVAPYAVCIQIAEPLFGLTASGLSFFFPYLSGRAGIVPRSALRKSVLLASICNLLLVSLGTGILLFFGSHFLRAWVGHSVASTASTILPPILLGSACSGLSVTGVYAMQALGRFRTVACISLGTRGLLLFVMLHMLHRSGLHGLAIARLCYGLASLLVYLPLARELDFFRKRDKSPARVYASETHLPKGVQP